MGVYNLCLTLKPTILGNAAVASMEIACLEFFSAAIGSARELPKLL
jgi:hypothetical protein